MMSIQDLLNAVNGVVETSQRCRFYGDKVWRAPFKPLTAREQAEVNLDGACAHLRWVLNFLRSQSQPVPPTTAYLPHPGALWHKADM